MGSSRRSRPFWTKKEREWIWERCFPRVGPEGLGGDGFDALITTETVGRRNGRGPFAGDEERSGQKRSDIEGMFTRWRWIAGKKTVRENPGSSEALDNR
jgi:hypothetical protein